MSQAMPTIFTATLATETNSFSPIGTGEASFREGLFLRNGEAPADLKSLFSGPLHAARQREAAGSCRVVQGLIAVAQPGGPTPRAVYEALREEILDDLRRAMPVDIVALGLHGAMIADGYDDCEGDLLACVRQLVGPDVPVGAELDPHCHISPQMLDSADILICFKENPHTDFLERGEELVALLERMRSGAIKPVTVVEDCRMFDSLNTQFPSMRAIVERMQALEDGSDVLSISVAHGFARGDVADMGTKVLVVTDDSAERGRDVARDIARRLWEQRGQSRPAIVPLERALDRACAGSPGTVILADAADNPGSGAPSDSTFIARALLQRGFDDFAVALLWDPQAVAFAMAAGEGARIALRIGGKACRMSGQPLDLDVQVGRIVCDGTQYFGAAPVKLGNAVAVTSGRAVFILTDFRNQAFSTDVFTAFGIDPVSKRVLVLKSAQHFRTSFAPIATEILLVDTPGVSVLDVTELPLRRIQRPKWPFDDMAMPDFLAKAPAD